MAMASLLLASPSPLSIQFNTSSSHLSFSHSQTFQSPLFVSFSSLSASSTSSLSATPFVYCGRGDRKTAKGKRFNRSFGNARPRNKNKGTGPPKIYTPPDPTKKEKLEDKEVMKIEINESLFN
ncbi:small ribosomal subunit protein bTHXc [Cicer arietinum]|uniref:30S ribosomal protein S31, chloroplastic n=1 Tax=Cicer arietinum TaxID=3827 RepID=A0A1S2YLZ0_CICAR|nr:30S ribosomal protein S31, chloroplastic [Cicer arietinum]